MTKQNVPFGAGWIFRLISQPQLLTRPSRRSWVARRGLMLALLFMGLFAWNANSFGQDKATIKTDPDGTTHAKFPDGNTIDKFPTKKGHKRESFDINIHHRHHVKYDGNGGWTVSPAKGGLTVSVGKDGSVTVNIEGETTEVPALNGNDDLHSGVKTTTIPTKDKKKLTVQQGNEGNTTITLEGSMDIEVGGKGITVTTTVEGTDRFGQKGKSQTTTRIDKGGAVKLSSKDVDGDGDIVTEFPNGKQERPTVRGTDVTDPTVVGETPAPKKEDKKPDEEPPKEKEKTPGGPNASFDRSIIQPPSATGSGFEVTAGIGGHGMDFHFDVNTVPGEGHGHHGAPASPVLFAGQPVHFRNGTLASTGFPGLAVVNVKSPTQITAVDGLFGKNFFDFDKNPGDFFAPGQTRDIQALLRSCCSSCEPESFSSSDFIFGADPQIALLYHLTHICWGDIEFGARYSFLTLEDDSGWGLTGLRTTTRRDVAFTGFQPNAGRIPTEAFVITNPAAFTAAQTGGLKLSDSAAPNITSKTSVTEIFSKERASVDFHQLAFPITLNFPQNNGPLSFFVQTGMTVNFYNTDVTTWTTTPRGTRSSESSKTPVRLGVSSEVGVAYAINSRWSVDAYAGYDFVGRASVPIGNSSTRLNASSPTFGLEVKMGF